MLSPRLVRDLLGDADPRPVSTTRQRGGLEGPHVWQNAGELRQVVFGKQLRVLG